MDLKSFSSATEYSERVSAFLKESEAQNCLGLGIIDTLINRPGTYPKAHLWELRDHGRIVGAAWMTPPHPIGLTEMPDQALELLIGEASRVADRPKSVVGPRRQADRFKDRWTERHRLTVKSTMEQRIYQITEVISPPAVPGELRLAEPRDQSLLEDWSHQFSLDCGLGDDAEKAKEYAAGAIKNRSRYLWTLNGEAVAMAGAGGSTPSGIRVNWVYTPASLRGKGYASALVAALSQKLLSEGRKFCFLYTDLANPTSNSIYQKIGYQPVCDSVHHTFGDDS